MDCCGRNRMVAGFITSYAMSAYRGDIGLH
jgi:hypothetical protein